MVYPMEKSLNEILEGRGGNYILPFFWQHGEDEAVLREEMARIHECGIGAVCLEARPHPDYAGPCWWRDVDIIMEEARARGMRVWILDDAHFPTGFANNWIRDRYPLKGKRYLNEKNTDVYGPIPSATLDVAQLLRNIEFQDITGGMSQYGGAPRKHYDDDELLAVVAARIGQGNRLDGTPLDLTARVKDGILHWDVPAGPWRIFALYVSRNGGGRQDCINIIDEASVRVQIDAVYEPHYQHYKDDFGKTLAGFFSDEPCFGNVSGYDFEMSIGRRKMPLPWNDDVPAMLADALGEGFPLLLPALWYEAGDADRIARVRYAYMDIVTRLYEKNFSRQLGDWCRARGVEYIGHIIEDGNAHARLGCSAGHFFRSMAGQDMSGVDVIGVQVLPGSDSYAHRYSMGGTYDGEFFHFALGKLGASQAHIDPMKKGRALCEIFGAYGWTAGTRLMKWLTDHSLVRGINWFVPHAFSPKEFPDQDCPPHFYARGMNPQYRHFGVLMRYMNRVCHLFNGGTHIAPAAILYHAESEWSGDYMLCQKPAAMLCRAQIDYDFIPADVFADPAYYDAKLEGNRLVVNGEAHGALIVPYSQRVPAVVAAFAAKAKKAGLAVIFIDALPQGISDADAARAGALLEGLSGCAVVKLEDMADYLLSIDCYDIAPQGDYPYLRSYHYRKGGTDYYMFFNEHPYETLEAIVDVRQAGPAAAYDALENALYPADARACGSGTRLRLKLSAYESVIVAFGGLEDAPVHPARPSPTRRVAIEGGWTLSLAEAGKYPEFQRQGKLAVLESVANTYPSFSGTMRYEKTFTLPEGIAYAQLALDSVYEAAEVWVNGEPAGTRICPPWRFELSNVLRKGENSIRIDVTNTLARAVNGDLNLHGGVEVLEPSGLIGGVSLLY
jgi:hypothetical protein